MVDKNKFMNDELLNHILFHKSLISEEENNRLVKYLDIAKNIGDVNYSTKKYDEYNLFDKQIMLIFELVVENEFNPWDIDLVKFSKLYLSEIQKRDSINLIIAGCIILKAWSILKLQSECILAEIERQNKLPEKENISWDSIPDWFIEDQDYDYTELILHNKVTLEEKIRRKSKRKVSLIELLEAFEDARNEAEKNIESYNISKFRRIENKQNMIYDVNNKLHKELGGEEISKIWNKIIDFNGKAISFSEICKNGNRDEFVTTILSLLYLATERKIVLWQNEFPYGEIFIQKQ